MTKYNVLIIGCGLQGVLADAPGTGNEHKTISFAKALNEQLKLFDVYLYDKDLVRLQQALNLYPNFKPDNQEIVYDIIIVAVPDEMHHRVLQNIPKMNPTTKLVICEKPLCMSSLECKEIIALYEHHNIPILVNYTRRFIPEIQKLKKHGKVVEGMARFNRGIQHTGTHASDFFNMFEFKSPDYMHLSRHTKTRYWFISLKFEDGYRWTEMIQREDPPPNYYDNHMKYVIKNAINYLNGTEDLLCTMYDGLQAVLDMEEYKNGIRQKRNGRSS